MRFRHVGGEIVEVPEHLSSFYSDSPSWKPYEEKKVESDLTKKQLQEVAFRQGKKPQVVTVETLVDSIELIDGTNKKDFDDDII